MKKTLTKEWFLGKKKIFLTSLALAAVTGAAALGSGQVLADANAPDDLIQAIAQKFNLKESDVQSVFDQHQKDRQNQIETRYKDKLNQAVKDGSLTEAQEKLLLDKQQALVADQAAQIANFKNINQDVRRATMQRNRQALSDWAKQNNIETKYLFGGFGRAGDNHKLEARNTQ